MEEGSVPLESRWGRRERNRSVLWVIIGNRKSTRKRRARGRRRRRGGLECKGVEGTRDTRGPVTVARRHPGVHARTRCVISDCLSGFAGGRGGCWAAWMPRVEVGAVLLCVGIGAPPPPLENVFSDWMKLTACAGTRAIDLRGGF